MTFKIEPVRAIFNPTDKIGEPQITHAEGCWKWGSRHYLCAMRRIFNLEQELAKLKEKNG